MSALEIAEEIAAGFGLGLTLWFIAWGAQIMFTTFRAVADPREPDLG